MWPVGDLYVTGKGFSCRERKLSQKSCHADEILRTTLVSISRITGSASISAKPFPGTIYVPTCLGAFLVPKIETKDL